MHRIRASRLRSFGRLFPKNFINYSRAISQLVGAPTNRSMVPPPPKRGSPAEKKMEEELQRRLRARFAKLPLDADSLKQIHMDTAAALIADGITNRKEPSDSLSLSEKEKEDDNISDSDLDKEVAVLATPIPASVSASSALSNSPTTMTVIDQKNAALFAENKALTVILDDLAVRATSDPVVREQFKAIALDIKRELEAMDYERGSVTMPRCASDPRPPTDDTPIDPDAPIYVPKDGTRRYKKERFDPWLRHQVLNNLKWKIIIAILVIGFLSFHSNFKGTLEVVGNPCDVQRPNTLFALRVLWGRGRSRLAKSISETKLPVSWRTSVYSVFARVTGAKLDEARYPLDAYENLQEFFGRALKDGARPVERPENLRIVSEEKGASFVSPVDGRLMSVGEIGEERRIPQIKGATYDVVAFLGSDVIKKAERKRTFGVIQRAPDSTSSAESSSENSEYSNTEFKNNPNIETRIEKSLFEDQVIVRDENVAVYYAVLYLAPGDYHRFHCPVDKLQIKEGRHYAGEVLFFKSFLINKRNTSNFLRNSLYTI